MRFSYFAAVGLAAAGALLPAPWSAAQDAEPDAAIESAPVAAAASAPEAEVAATPVAEACPPRLDSDFVPGLGQPGAWLDAEQAIYAPPGANALGHPVSYLIVTGPGENDSAEASVRKLTYRLAGLNTRWGAEYNPDLRTAFDRAVGTEVCGDGSAACMVDFRGAVAGQRSGAELSNSAPSPPGGASQGVLRLIKADYDLDGADPVYLVCHYAQ